MPERRIWRHGARRIKEQHYKSVKKTVYKGSITVCEIKPIYLANSQIAGWPR